MPWGDRCVAAMRAQRLQRFRAKELKHEKHWAKSRLDVQAQAKPLSVRWRVSHLLHELRVRPALGVPAATVFSVVLFGCTFMAFSALPRKTPHPRDVATGRCVDGSWTYARNRSGACAGHGGVKVFYR
ncbi:MAG TPA: DUF3761 domain-containing protein [Abditibacteriaceae bacterium]